MKISCQYLIILFLSSSEIAAHPLPQYYKKQAGGALCSAATMLPEAGISGKSEHMVLDWSSKLTKSTIDFHAGATSSIVGEAATTAAQAPNICDPIVENPKELLDAGKKAGKDIVDKIKDTGKKIKDVAEKVIDALKPKHSNVGDDCGLDLCGLLGGSRKKANF